MSEIPENETALVLEQTLVKCGLSIEEAKEISLILKDKYPQPTEEDIAKAVNEVAELIAGQISDKDNLPQRENILKKLNLECRGWIMALIASGSYDLLKFVYDIAKNSFMAAGEDDAMIENRKNAAQRSDAAQEKLSTSDREFLADRWEKVRKFREIMWLDLEAKLKADSEIEPRLDSIHFILLSKMLENKLAHHVDNIEIE